MCLFVYPNKGQLHALLQPPTQALIVPDRSVLSADFYQNLGILIVYLAQTLSKL